MTSIVFHSDLLYNWRLVSETSQRVLKPMKTSPRSSFKTPRVEYTALPAASVHSYEEFV